jgi:hypothetical protein
MFVDFELRRWQKVRCFQVIVVLIMMNDVQATVILLNGKEVRKFQAKYRTEKNPVDTGMGDDDRAFARRLNDILESWPGPLLQIKKTLASCGSVVDKVPTSLLVMAGELLSDFLNS